MLPHGLFDGRGRCHRQATLLSLSGAEELAIAERAPSAKLASALLASSVARVGELEPFDATHARALSRGDRAHLALHLLATLRGDRVSLIPRCPNSACGALADLDLSIRELAPEKAEPTPEVLELSIDGSSVLLREPIGADDELFEGVADRKRASDELWSRLIVAFDGQPIDASSFSALAPGTRQKIALELAEKSSGPELAYLARCPECQAVMEVLIDPFSLLFREISRSADRIYAEVHTFAFHYHWTEQEVLALPRARRWKYLELLRRQLEGRPLLDPRVTA
jgi:hypothetical protein